MRKRGGREYRGREDAEKRGRVTKRAQREGRMERREGWREVKRERESGEGKEEVVQREGRMEGGEEGDGKQGRGGVREKKQCKK